MLRKVLKKFLQRHPDWQATVVGGGVPATPGSSSTTAEEWERRISYRGVLSHEQLMVEYSRSKIYLMASRYESFCIAAAEALCCGCSVVGSSEIPSSLYFAEPASGTVAAVRTPKSFIEALDREVELWSQGKRDPGTIATVWKGRVGSEAVAQSTLEFLENSHA